MAARRGILGGTFNPVHIGHLAAAETALDQLGLDQVLWVPNQAPPYKSQADILENSHRLELIRRAIAPHPPFQLSEVELNRPGTSYAVDTWQQLQASDPESEWYWILGLDSFLSLPHWHRCQELIPQCIWLVAPRPITDVLFSDVHPAPSSMAEPPRSTTAAVEAEMQRRLQQKRLDGIPLRWQFLDMPQLEISSSLIRRYCRDRRSIRYLVPDPVWRYLEIHQLYQSS
ncbi:MAG: nicotinate-nucleotide adenylyltransferase [Synechococcales bacterium]|nr:nicotinate-nucleotide adenylyltransferase [Synechococcales bacterium]